MLYLTIFFDSELPIFIGLGCVCVLPIHKTCVIKFANPILFYTVYHLNCLNLESLLRHKAMKQFIFKIVLKPSSSKDE